MTVILVVEFRSRLVAKSDFSAIGRSKHTPKICPLSGSQKTVLSGKDWSQAITKRGTQRLAAIVSRSCAAHPTGLYQRLGTGGRQRRHVWGGASCPRADWRPGFHDRCLCALAAYALTSLTRRDAGIGRPAAVIIACIAPFWLLLVLFGVLKAGLQRWSPLAVMLLVLAFPDRSGTNAGPHESHPAEDARKPLKPPCGPHS